MAGETVVTVVGNLTADPELRFTASGAPVAGFTIAATPRLFDRDSGGFRDGDPLFLRCSLWRKAAENVVLGMRVIVTGRIRSRMFEDKEGQRPVAPQPGTGTGGRGSRVVGSPSVLTGWPPAG